MTDPAEVDHGAAAQSSSGRRVRPPRSNHFMIIPMHLSATR